MEILKIIDRSKGMSAVLVPTIETGDKLSGTTSNQLPQVIIEQS